jgi:hypothetical protein
VERGDLLIREGMLYSWEEEEEEEKMAEKQTLLISHSQIRTKDKIKC